MQIKDQIRERVLEVTNIFLNQDLTVRQIADDFGVSKSTIHMDLRKRLQIIDNVLYLEVDKVLNEHRDTRHLKGGQATKEKYLAM